MKKKILALLLGGVMAVGGALAIPATAQASDSVTDQGWQNWAKELDCKGFSDAHIKSHNVDVVNGLLTVTLEVESGSTKPVYWGGGIFLREEEQEPMSDVGDGKTYYDFNEFGSLPNTYFPEDAMNGGKGSFNFTFEGLTVGKTYYVYGYVYDAHDTNEATHGVHYVIYLGSGVPTATSAPGSSSFGSTSVAVNNIVVQADSSTTYEEDLTSQITEAQPGATIVMEQGVTTLPNSVMKELLKRKDVSLKLEFTYQDKEYVIIIPAGAALDNDIPYYGPLYLAQHFGNRAGTNTSAASGTGATYEIQSGDCLSKIAAANNMTLKQLLAKNPQIKDPDKIAAGQKINR